VASSRRETGRADCRDKPMGRRRRVHRAGGQTCSWSAGRSSCGPD